MKEFKHGDLHSHKQTALVQACQYGHWEVVQTLILFKANFLLALIDFVLSIIVCNSALHEIINRPADGGITALHMAALNGHVETVQLLLDLGASASDVTVEDGTTIDLIGAGSTALYYAAWVEMHNVVKWTPLMVTHSWHRDGLEEILSTKLEEQPQLLPSPFLCLPLMSIVKIARECGWRNNDNTPACLDPCVVCLERKCTVAVEGTFPLNLQSVLLSREKNNGNVVHILVMESKDQGVKCNLNSDI
ncbi:hypothetical protein Vadar_004332 [Vaccinium darrowii]|uniref:Uncharacterized protein n=1 Tax=Vaccinium darrowii TaxID=229202 RepID=A0ACB7XWS7_9ERIC|nr:hypothetical protein Vadar_004332 [Vaccinium darrowii]